jgi:hypothetical protein
VGVGASLGVAGVEAVAEERVVGAGRAGLRHDRRPLAARQLARRVAAVAHVGRGHAGKHHPAVGEIRLYRFCNSRGRFFKKTS